MYFVTFVTFFTKIVPNFISFPPLGITIVATLGIGIAESSGYIHVLLKKLLAITPKNITNVSTFETTQSQQSSFYAKNIQKNH
jgi:p-aminobenzoyl-glutamate transporter AbgT